MTKLANNSRQMFITYIIQTYNKKNDRNNKYKISIPNDNNSKLANKDYKNNICIPA